MDDSRRTSKVKMKSDKATGIFDHEFIDPGEVHWTVPCRFVAGNLGSHFTITFTKPEQMPNQTFEMGMKLIEEEILKLKEVLEK